MKIYSHLGVWLFLGALFMTVTGEELSWKSIAIWAGSSYVLGYASYSIANMRVTVKKRKPGTGN